MEELFKRQFTVYTNTFQRDYNDIPKNIKTLKKDVDDFLFVDQSNYENPTYIGSEKHPYFKHSHSTNSEQDFEKNYGNPLCGVQVSRLTFVVEKSEDKVSMKVYLFYKHRAPGKPYFVKTTTLNFVTYNIKTNDLYSGQIRNSFKKRKNSKSLKRNYFASKPFNQIHSILHNNFNNYKHNLPNETSLDIWLPALNTFTSQIPNYKYDFMLNTDENFYKHYLLCRGIKFPDNFKTFINAIPLPSKRLLKKCGYKLVESFMVKNDFVGDKIRKVLQNCSFINISFYQDVQKFFGEKFLRHQSEKVLKSIFEFNHGYHIPGHNNLMTEAEKKNAFDVFINSIGHTGSLQTFIDHINFYVMLRQFEEIKWKSNNISSFNKEHTEWSDKYAHYTTGTYTRLYSESFISKMKESIDWFNLEYFPVLLTKSSEYNMESLIQSNCVKNYINKPSSIIISIREGSEASTERATIEYHIRQGNKNKFYIERVQSLGRFNQKLSDKWNYVLSELDKRIDKLSEDFKLPKIIVEVGDKVIESESKINDYGYLSWVSEHITNLKPSYQIIHDRLF